MTFYEKIERAKEARRAGRQMRRGKPIAFQNRSFPIWPDAGKVEAAGIEPAPPGFLRDAPDCRLASGGAVAIDPRPGGDR